jgi:hypothetical protein
MSDYLGVVQPLFSSQAGASGSRHLLPGRSTNVTGGLALPATTERGIILSSPAAAPSSPEPPDLGVGTTYVAALQEPVGQYWFEKMHSLPQFFELGNILATITRDIEVYSSYREEQQDFNTATNNAGVGVAFINLPSLPTTINPQTGLVFQVQVQTSGPPNIEGTLDLDFDFDNLSLPITGKRVVMFPYEPETPIRETLEWKTSILTSINGKEQRMSLRKNPRQLLEFMLRVEEGDTRRKLQTLLFGWQPGVFGIPIWFEARYLDVTANVSDTTIYVDTRFADFRTQSLAIVWRDDEYFDALEVNSMTDSSLTFSSPITKQFLAGQTLVMPLRVGLVDSNIPIQRYAVNLEDISFMVTIQDNDSDIGDTSDFPSYNSKVLLSEPNRMPGNSLPASFERDIIRIDNELGPAVQSSDWLAPNFMTEKGFFCRSLERKWQVRKLVHALRGSQVTFYLPTFYQDLELADDLSNTSDLMDIVNIGYSTYIDGQSPADHVQIELADGTFLRRQIIAAEAISESIERLTVDSAWTSDVAKEDVTKVTYLRTARIADDRVTLVHSDAQEAEIMMSVKEVQQ